MIPAKEKAKELYNKYFKFCNELSHDKNKTLAKLMAITCVDEILSGFGLRCQGQSFYSSASAFNYWEEVKQEIEKL